MPPPPCTKSPGASTILLRALVGACQARDGWSVHAHFQFFFFALIVGIGLTFGLPLKQQAPFTPFPGNNNHTCAYTHTHAPGIRFRFCAPAYPPPRCTIKWEKCLSHSMFRDTEPTHLSLRQYCFLFHPSRPIGLSYSSSTAVHPTSARDEGKTNPSRITPGVRTGTQHLLHLPPETKKAQVVRFGAARE